MSRVITKRVRLSRRAFLKGMTLTGTAVQVGLPPLVTMFNSHGTAYAAASNNQIESRFVFWFNGNGIPERYWIPGRTGADFDMPPCLSPLASFRSTRSTPSSAHTRTVIESSTSATQEK